MLLEFVVENFRSIGHPQCLSMVATADKTLPGNVIVGEDGAKQSGRVLRSAVVFGPNAAGKSNLIRALGAMQRLVVGSATELTLGDTMPWLVPFKLNAEYLQRASRFEITLAIDGDIYRYGFESSESLILSEWLYVTRKAVRSREVLVFNRVGSDKSQWTKGSNHFLRHWKGLLERTRADNCLLLSKAAQEDFAEAAPIFNWFKSKLKILDFATPLSESRLMQTVGEACYSNPEVIQPLAKLLELADTGIEGIQVNKGPSEATVELQRRVAKKVLAERRSPFDELPEVVSVRSVRKIPGSDESVSFSFDEESKGTQQFLVVGSILIDAMKHGQTVVIDELDRSMHHMLSRAVIQIMNDPEIGHNMPQFIISTHDLNLMDFDLLRRDQIYLVEKNAIHESEIFSLSSLSPLPKLESPALRSYLSERFGGIPGISNLRHAFGEVLTPLGESTV